MKKELDKRTDTEETAGEQYINPAAREITSDIVAKTEEQTVTDNPAAGINSETPEIVSEETMEEIKAETKEEPQHKKSLPPLSPDLFSSQPKKEEYLNTGHMPGDEDGWVY